MIKDNITVIGNDHVFKNIECQDSSDSWEGDGYCAVIVCDGHGGSKYIRSKKGSETACKVGRATIESFMEGLRKEVPPAAGGNPFLLDKVTSEVQLVQLERAIILRWNEEISAHLEENPLEEDPRFEVLSDAHKKSLERTGERAYGTTFIAAVLTDHFCFVLKLGDGNVAMLSSEGGFFPEEFPYNPWDFNGTFSMCDSDADAMFTHCFYENSDSVRIDGVTVMTDGAVNSFGSMESYVKFISNVFDGYNEDEVSVAHDELTDALNRFTKNGSGDDISIGVIIKPSDALKNVEFELESDVKKEESGLDLMSCAEEPVDQKEPFDEAGVKTDEEILEEDIDESERYLEILNMMLEEINGMINEIEKTVETDKALCKEIDGVCGILSNDSTDKVAISKQLWYYIEKHVADSEEFLKDFVIAEENIENDTEGQSSAEENG